MWWFRRLLLLILALSLLETASLAQPVLPSPPFSVLIAQWTRILNEAEQLAQLPGISADQVETYRRLLDKTRAEAQTARQTALKQVTTFEGLLNALGRPPGPDQPPETGEVAAKRRQYTEDLADYRARVALADLAITRAETAELILQKLGRGQLRAFLQERGPSPLESELLMRGWAEMQVYLQFIAQIPIGWFQGLTPGDRTFVLGYSGLAITLSIVMGWMLRRFLRRRFGCDPALPDPSYRRRLGAAMAEGVANGVIPALILGALLSWASLPENLLTGPVRRVYTSLGTVLIFYILCVALVYAVLNPKLPQWRLFALPSRAAAALSRRIALLTALMALDWFLRTAVTDTLLSSSPPPLAAYSVLLYSSQALALFALTQGWLWQREEPVDAGQGPPKKRRWFTLVRRLVAGGALLTVVALLSGYGNFGGYLIRALLATGFVAGLLFLLHGLLVELLDLALTHASPQTDAPQQSQIVLFWFNFLLTSLLSMAGVVLVAPLWGIPLADLWAWSRWALDGVVIGQFILSPKNIGTAILIFSVALMVNRLIQRLLLKRILPQTRLSPGAQYSIAVGIGYFGVLITILLGIAALGIELESIALVAGALSVGIGFGLRNIVNNLLSGMILLIERPLKVGDWVIVGDKEGIVRQINMRSTELENFQRSSVIVPNADMIAYPIINMTHHDTLGRIDITVGVAYGSDPQHVRNLLLECARRHLKVLYNPEPFVLFQQFGPSRMEFELRCFTGDVLNRLIIASDLRYAIEERFRAEGIIIPFPQQVVHLASTPAESGLRSADPSRLHPDV